MVKVKKHIYIKENLATIKRLVKSGDISGKLLNDYNLYHTYLTQTGGKMQRYQDTADYGRVSTLTVMKAIKSMESKV